MIYKVIYGTPEEFVPSKFAPAPKCAVTETSPENVSEVAFSTSKRGCKLVLPLTPATKIYGLGLQLKGFNHRGNKLALRVNADPRSTSGDSHAPVPFFVTNEGWGIYIDTARSAVFQCGSELNTGMVSVKTDNIETKVMNSTDELYSAKAQSSSVMTVEIPYAEGVTVYFITGEKIIDIVSEYNLLSGGGCMPPMWGLGNFYRCCGQFNEQQVADMADNFRKLRLPCDILGLEPGWHSTSYSCSYVWSSRFPNHKDLLSKLNGNGFKVNLWEHAFTHPMAPFHDNLIPYSADYLVWAGLVPDFSLSEASKIFSDYHKDLCNEGITGFKLDECDGSDFTGGWSFPDCAELPSGMDGEQYHHLFGELYSKTILEALGNSRTLSEVRNMGALGASYPFVLYSDLYDFEDFLLGTVNSGFSGLLWSPEVRHAENKSDLIRRLQLVSFSVQSLVNAWYLDKMPWLDLGATDEVREILENRMRMLPYLYTAFYDYMKLGKPPVRALVCDYPLIQDIKDEYLFGDLIVAPIAPNKTGRDVILPEGDWYGLFDRKLYRGGLIHVETENIPVFVPSGTLLPLAEPLQFAGDDPIFQITLTPFGDCQDSVCRLVEGDMVNITSEFDVLSLRLGDTLNSKHYCIK